MPVLPFIPEPVNVGLHELLQTFQAGHQVLRNGTAISQQVFNGMVSFLRSTHHGRHPLMCLMSPPFMQVLGEVPIGDTITFGTQGPILNGAL